MLFCSLQKALSNLFLVLFLQPSNLTTKSPPIFGSLPFPSTKPLQIHDKQDSTIHHEDFVFCRHCVRNLIRLCRSYRLPRVSRRLPGHPVPQWSHVLSGLWLSLPGQHELQSLPPELHLRTLRQLLPSRLNCGYQRLEDGHGRQIGMTSHLPNHGMNFW